MYNTDIWDEFINILGLNKDEIKKIKDEVKKSLEKNGEAPETTTRVKKYPEPFADERIKEVTEKDYGVQDYCDKLKKNIVQEEPIHEKECACPRCGEVKAPEQTKVNFIRDDIAHYENAFTLAKHAKDVILTDFADLVFEDVKDGYVTPGITEDQLLWVLYVRYQNNPKKLALVKQLIYA